jgi:tetratricopeptide (TPR) repeat protein
LKATLAQIPSGVDPDGNVTAGRWDASMIERDYAGAERALTDCPLAGVSYLNNVLTAKGFLEGCIALAQGDDAKAQASFETARPAFEAAAQESPDDATRRANLGLLYAFMHRKDEAMAEARRAVELMPETKDAVDGAIMNCFLALVYARVNKPDLAFPLLERLLQTPGAVDSTLYSVTVNDLRARWVWDPLRNDPRFARLIATSP